MAMIDINGQQVDDSKPCDIAKALRSAMITVATGGTITVARFGEDEMRYGGANVTMLRELVSHYEGQCLMASGQRRRFAKTMRFVR